MTTKYNLKNPGVKRIMQEAKELAKESSYEYSAHPLEDNLFEWHFTLRGPSETDFENGRYHGRILLPNEYPFEPPEIMFLTPNGRFELNKKVCLSITGFHPEFWQPAWGIRTVLLAVIGFFPTEAKGAIGGLDYTKEERQKLAKKSLDSTCPVCKTCMKDALSDTPPDENTIKEELPAFMISYKQEETSTSVKEKAPQTETEETDEKVDKGDSIETLTSEKVKTKVETTSEKVNGLAYEKAVPDEKSESSGPSTDFVIPKNPRVLASPPPQQQMTTRLNSVPVWLDALIAGLVSFLVVLIYRRYLF